MRYGSILTIKMNVNISYLQNNSTQVLSRKQYETEHLWMLLLLYMLNLYVCDNQLSLGLPHPLRLHKYITQRYMLNELVSSV